jgi:hypothetical protein
MIKKKKNFLKIKILKKNKFFLKNVYCYILYYLKIKIDINYNKKNDSFIW